MSTILIAGIDEAGRGAVIGPMVIAGVVIDENDESKLVKIGVRDSKELSPAKREKLASEIEKIAKDIFILRIPACKIDSYRASGINLDRIEAMKMAEIINIASADKVYVDSLNNPPRFQKIISEHLHENNKELVVKNFLDESIPVVSAASIIAKTERDKSIKEIKRKVNFDFGVGYSHDSRTIEFIDKLIRERKELPPFIRQSWVTTQVLKENSLQRKIKEFFFKKKEQCKEGER